MARRHEISDLLLEQFVLEELPEDLAERVRAELARDPELRSRRDAIERSNREILERYPPAGIVDSIRERLFRGEQSRARRRRTAPFVIGLPAAAALLVFLSIFAVRERNVMNETRLKGLATHLAVFRKTAQGAEELRPGALAGRGEVIQLSYTAGEARYGVIFSVDGRGAVTWHLPPAYAGGLRTSPALEKQGQVILPSAYELDDAPGFERFFLVYGESPFDVSAVEGAVKAMASRAGSAERAELSLPAGLRQSSLLLRKRGSGP